MFLFLTCFSILFPSPLADDNDVMFTEEIIREVLAAMKVCIQRFHQSSLDVFSKTELMLPELPYLNSSYQLVGSS